MSRKVHTTWNFLQNNFANFQLLNKKFQILNKKLKILNKKF